MSYIPDCREKYLKDIKKSVLPVTAREGQINPYWYGLLKGDDREFLKGYDWNTMHAVNSLFDNLDVYSEYLEEVGINCDEIDEDIVNGAVGTLNENLAEVTDQRKVWTLDDFSEEELGKMSMSTKLMLTIKHIVSDWIEQSRDELVSSMVESMDDKEHAKAVKEAEKTPVTTKVYGYSDDLVDIEPAPYPYDENGCWEQKAVIEFSDNTVIEVQYNKRGDGIWSIEVIKEGTAKHRLTVCEEETDEGYSDIFEIEAEFVKITKKDI